MSSIKSANIPMSHSYKMLNHDIGLILYQMTTPMIFGMVSILLMNLVDLFFIAKLGTQELAAVSFTFPITFLVNCIIMGLGSGITTCIANLLGKNKITSAKRFAIHSVILTIITISTISVLGFITIDLLFSTLGASFYLLLFIKPYMSIWYLTAPLLAISMVGNSIIRSTGDTKSPAKIIMLSGIINLALDPLLIFGYGSIPKLGVMGAALASSISWLIALSYSSYILIWKKNLLTMPVIKYLKPDFKQVLAIAAPAAMAKIMLPLANAAIISFITIYGEKAIAAYGAAQRIESILLIILMALSSSLMPFIAQNLGAKKPDRVLASIFISMRFSVMLQALIFLAIIPLSMQLAKLFSNDADVINLIWLYLLIIPISYGFQGIMMIANSYLNATYQPNKAFLWNFIHLFAFVVPAAYLGAHLHDMLGLLIGIAIANILGGTLSYWYIKSTCQA